MMSDIDLGAIVARMWRAQLDDIKETIDLNWVFEEAVER
jgi:hypothetical protein